MGLDSKIEDMFKYSTKKITVTQSMDADFALNCCKELIIQKSKASNFKWTQFYEQSIYLINCSDLTENKSKHFKGVVSLFQICVIRQYQTHFKTLPGYRTRQILKKQKKISSKLNG